MLDSVAVHLLNMALTQTEPEAEPWVQYLVLGSIGLVILWVLVKAFSNKGHLEQKPTLEVDPENVDDSRSKAELEAEARRRFEIPEVLMGEEPSSAGFPQVRIKRTTVDSTPVTRDPSMADVQAEPPASEVTAEPSKEEPEESTADPSAERAGKTLREGLAKTHAGFIGKLGKLFGRAETLNDDLLGDLEEALFTADIGVRTSQRLVEMVQAEAKRGGLSPDGVWETLKDHIREVLQVEAEPLDVERAKPLVIMVVGVNGAGKTTTIGKLASRFTADGKKVLLAAGDTFRAAAVEQLEAWAERADVAVARGQERQDPSSVIFDACTRAVQENFDICIADTAGRLQSRSELMDELKKVHRTIGKAIPGAPHEVWLVLDSTNGQNAISQAKEFAAAVDVSGLVLTKLDGAAKGGVVIGICDEMKLPVRFIGIGERVEDLRVFEPAAFAEALFSES